MKLPLALAMVALLPATAHAQAQLQLDDAIKLGEMWVRANVDPKVLEALPQIDEKQAVQLLLQFQQQFQGEYVVDVVRLKQVANLALPFIERDEALKVYAPWLRSRMDYFEVAQRLSLVVPPPPKAAPALPGQPPPPAPPPPVPTPQQQQQVWTQVVATEPWPASAQRYVPQLKPIFASERVPTELVWLAEVESSFEPKAKSPAGAAGLYQLMPETAKRQGLSLAPRDQRLDPASSARASARYLHTLHGEFKDWPLTLAAYNVGEGRVRTLMTKYKAKSFDGIAPHLPAETQMYVPKVSAVIQRREGKALAKL